VGELSAGIDRAGELVAGAKAYLAAHPSAKFDEVHSRFFADPDREYRSGKCISSRHFEAIGTETCQILLEGGYNGILEPDVHYIAVRRDLANLDEALERFGDEDYRRELVKRTREFALDGHTYDHRVAQLLAEVG
jgi:spore maturation protein CgeB